MAVIDQERTFNWRLNPLLLINQNLRSSGVAPFPEPSI